MTCAGSTRLRDTLYTYRITYWYHMYVQYIQQRLLGSPVKKTDKPTNRQSTLFFKVKICQHPSVCIILSTLEWWSELALGGLEENVLALTAKIADLQQQTISGHRQNADRVGTYLHELRNKLSASSKRMEATLNSMTADLRQDNHQIRIDNSQLKTTVTQLEAAANEARQRQNALVNLCRSLQGQVTSLSNRIKKLEVSLNR